MQSVHDLNQPRRKARIGLRGYLFCCLGLVAALPVLVLGVIQVTKWEAKQMDDVDQERQFVAQTLIQGIGQMVDGHVRAVETLAGQVQARGSLDQDVLQPMVSSLRARYGGFSVMYIAGADGVSIVTDPPFNEDGKPNAGTDYSKRDYYRAMVRTGRTAISRVQIGKRSGVPNVQIAAPVRDPKGDMVGFVEGSLDLDGIQELVDSTIKGMPGLQVAVLDHEGRVIVYPDEKVRKAVKNLSHLALFKKLGGNGIEIRTGVDDKGVAMRASITTLTAYDLDWSVVVYRPQVYEQSQAAAARTQVLTVAGLALLVGLIIATALAEGLARPIRKLANVVTAVSKGDLSQMPEPPHALTPREMAALQVDVRHMVGQLKDYTTHMEKKIEERTEQVREANRELESFLYSITHDLKAPVISLYGMAAMLQKKCGEQLGEQGAHYLRRLMSNAGFMEQLITDLLNFSKAGKHEYRREQLDVDRVVKKSLDQCDSRIREGHVTVKVRSPLPSVVFDHNALCKIFLNIISNGMKFMGDQAHPCIEIGGRELDGFVEYYVKDNGIGIDQKYHDKVFKMFQRLKEVSVEGTGIGLAIVKKIVDMAGGRIWFESEVGKGTTFFFRIPKEVSARDLGDGYELERVSNG
jgi:signal transduction histidine kinase/sensor domain CHASE-containing protein